MRLKLNPIPFKLIVETLPELGWLQEIELVQQDGYCITPLCKQFSIGEIEKAKPFTPKTVNWAQFLYQKIHQWSECVLDRQQKPQKENTDIP